MSRSSDYDLFWQDLVREELGLEGDAVIDTDDLGRYVSPPSNFEWYASKLETPIDLEAIDGPTWDVFISYASEHRAALALPLSEALREIDVEPWIDVERISPGAVEYPINRGVARVSVGVLIISPEYVHKQWTNYELQSLVSCGLRTFVLVGYGLDDVGESALRRLDEELSRHLDITSLTLRSNRVKGLSGRIRVVVRRSRRTVEPATAELLDHIEDATQEFAHAVANPYQLAAQAADAARAQYHRELRDTCDRYFGGDWEAMADKLPPEAFGEDDDPVLDEWGYER